MKSIGFKQFASKLDNLKSYKDLFSNLLSKKIDSLIVVDISSKLRIMSVDIKNELRIDAFKSVSIPKDKKDEVILSSLRDFIAENGIESKSAVLLPSLKSLILKRIQLPAVPDSELAEAIKWQLKEDVHFDLAQAVIDFSVIKKTTKDDGSKVLDIICVVAKEEEVKQNVLLLKEAGLSCLSVGLSTFGYQKLIKRLMAQDKDKPMAILHLCEDISYFSIYKNDNLDFYRELPVSINKLRDSLKGVLVSDKGKVELSTDEINDVLFNIGIPEKESVYKDKIGSTQILSMLRPVLERLAVEIERSLSYYDSEFAGGSVSKMLIASLALRIPNLDKFLKDELSLEVEKLSLKEKLTFSSTINYEELSESYAALGVALEFQEGINLLPYEFRTEKIEKVQKVSLRWIVFIAVLLLVMSFLLTKARIGAYQRKLNSSALHLSTLSEVKQIKIGMEEFDNFVIDIRRNEPSLNAILKKLSNIASNELFFSNFSLNADSKTGSIDGYIKSVNKNPDSILTEFVRNMKDSVYFSDATISQVDKESKHGFDITRFNITFKLVD